MSAASVLGVTVTPEMVAAARYIVKLAQDASPGADRWEAGGSERAAADCLVRVSILRRLADEIGGKP